MKNLAHKAFVHYLRHFPIAKGKTRLFYWLWKPLSFGEYQREGTLRQANVRLHCDLNKFLQRRLYFWGGYEEEQCDFWIKMAQKSSTIFDVGTNIGLYSLLAAAANPQASIHAFEPTPEIVEALSNNIRLNSMHNIIVNAAAVGSYNGKGFLHRIMGGEDVYDGTNYITEASAPSAELAIPVITIEDYCRQNNIDHINLMKIDIEGGEYGALLGASRLLQTQAIGCILLELVESHANRSGHFTREIKHLLLDAGYQIYQLRSGQLVPVPYEKVHEGDGDNVIAVARGIDRV